LTVVARTLNRLRFIAKLSLGVAAGILNWLAVDIGSDRSSADLAGHTCTDINEYCDSLQFSAGISESEVQGQAH